jgi:polar amino acid transport system substrate-binding protein
MNSNIAQHLAPTGTLRAGVFTGNILLITGASPTGVPQGVSPDMCQAIAEQLGVKLELIPFKSQDELVESVASGACDIGLVGSDPARAKKITFTPAYVEIEATYLVPAGSEIQTVAQVDQPGMRIAVPSRSAYELWLSRNLKHAKLVMAEGFEATINVFLKEQLEALAGLRVALTEDAKKIPGSRLLEQNFATIEQAISTRNANTAGLEFLTSFVEQAKASGLVASLIAKHRVNGLVVAPPQKVALA